MFIEERHQAILDIIKQSGRISIGEIVDRFAVSVDSARRDLRLLEEQGLLKRTHGGAIPLRQIGFTKPSKCTARDFPSIKENYFFIAMQALKLIKENDVIYITSGTVGYFMAQNLPEIKITVVTNSIIIAEEVRKKDNIRIILIGGDMTPEGVCKSALAVEMVSRIRLDIAFITSASISADFGLSIQSAENVGFLNAVIHSAVTTVGLYPTEKIGFRSILQICPANRLDLLITDWDAPEDELKKLDELDVKIIIVEKESKEE
ncbi:MAG: hypothetical protein BGN88_12260 [Clostridiales bacterium 43-6]|nr:MAG: hypothetical protein BGN88_12260 [Clostridiales bacterium 43-6]